MKIRHQITFTARFENVAAKFFIEAKGYQLPCGYIATKKLTKDSDGDFKYSSQWAIYDQRSGALIASGETPTFLLDRTATPAQLLNKLRPSRIAKQVKTKRETLEPAETPKYFTLGKLAPLPKLPKPKSTKGYSLFNQLISEVKSAIAETQHLNSHTHSLKLTFRIHKTMYKVNDAKNSLTRFLTDLQKKQKFMSDAIFAAPIVTHVETISEADKNSFRDYFMPASAWVDLQAYRARVEAESTAPTPTPKTVPIDAVAPIKRQPVCTFSKPKIRTSCEDNLKAIMRGDNVKKSLINQYINYFLIQKMGDSYSLTSIGKELVELSC